jgi:hypothetical protein
LPAKSGFYAQTAFALQTAILIPHAADICEIDEIILQLYNDGIPVILWEVPRGYKYVVYRTMNVEYCADISQVTFLKPAAVKLRTT